MGDLEERPGIQRDQRFPLQHVLCYDHITAVSVSIEYGHALNPFGSQDLVWCMGIECKAIEDETLVQHLLEQFTGLQRHAVFIIRLEFIRC